MKALRPTLPLMLVLLASAGGGAQRLVRRFDHTDGMPVSSVAGMVQDSYGFLWLGSQGGLLRFDGNQILPWGTDRLKRNIDWLYAGPNGQVYALPEHGMPLYRVVTGGLEAVLGPDGRELQSVMGCAFDSEGALWVAKETAILRRETPHSPWRDISVDHLRGERIRKLRTADHGGILIVTNAGVWRISLAAGLRRIYSATGISDVLATPDGSVFLAIRLPGQARVLEVRDGGAAERLRLAARPNAFVARGNAVWLSFDHFLVAFHPGAPPEILGPQDGPFGGNALADREGSLWMSAGPGLLHIPEPDTVIRGVKDGLPSDSARYLQKTAEGVWISTWYGLGRLEPAGGGWRGRSEPLPDNGRLCTDADGTLWTSHPRRQGRFLPLEFGGVAGCHRASDGTVWLTNDRGLLRTGIAGRAPRLLPTPLERSKGPGQVLEDRHGRVWISQDERVCQAPAPRVMAEDLTAWTCHHLAGARDVKALAETASGAIWAGTWSGIWELKDGRAQRIPASMDLPTPSVNSLVASPKGGIWVVADSAVVRVVERPDLPKGWETVESLSPLQGFPLTLSNGLLEESDGTLWVATNMGVVQMPAAARQSRLDPPPILLTGVSVNGSRREPAGSLQLPAGENHLELDFAALCFRDRTRLRYQYRLRPDNPWLDETTGRPVFRFEALRAGRYRAEVRASLDGTRWSQAPASIDLEVLPPLYQRSWALASFALAIGGLGYLIHRVRVAMLLRLERQRTRIAMDLHDEIGSGLGSIGILSGLLAAGDVDERKRQRLAQTIVETAGELGAALSDIVWSLRQDAATLEAVACHLRRRAQGLFPEGGPELIVRFPDAWPDYRLSLAVRRNLLLIALEALHNAARHADANQVVLGLARDGESCKLWVSDNGRGLKSGPAGSGGIGLTTMRKRAQEIGASLACDSRECAGTTVTVQFQADGGSAAQQY